MNDALSSNNNAEESNKDEGNKIALKTGFNSKKPLSKRSHKKKTKQSTNANTPQSELNKDKSSDSEEKDVKRSKQKHSRYKIEEFDENGNPYKTGRWTDEEHRKFMKAIKLFGKDWK